MLLNDPEIAHRIKSARRVLLGLDFDGTLTPIVPDPLQAQLAPEVRELIVSLARLRKFVPMIVSGRSLADVSVRVGIEDLHYAGNHGMEILGPGLTYTDPIALDLQPRLLDLTAALFGRFATVTGVLVEPKGLTTTIHYRDVALADRPVLGSLLRDAVFEAGADHFEITSGLLVWEIRPIASSNKGIAMRHVLQALQPAADLVIFLGDDTTDEDAFREFPDQITVKIGAARPTAARYALAGPNEVKAFLKGLWATGSCASGNRSNGGLCL